MNLPNISLFAMHSSLSLGQSIAEKLSISLSQHEEFGFDDGEHASRILESVREKTVFVIQSLYSDNEMNVNEKLCRLLFFIGALRDAAAKHIIVIAPYLCYARQDRKVLTRDTVATRYLAYLFEAFRVDQLVTFDIHNLEAFHNAFRCMTDNLQAKNLFIHYLEPFIQDDEIIVMSPDVGGIKRAEQFRLRLENKLNRKIEMLFMEKQRNHREIISASVVGSVNPKNKTIIIVDDMISSGKTISLAANACKKAQAKKIYVVATHGLFVEKSNEILKAAPIDKIIVTNTVTSSHLTAEDLIKKIHIIDVTLCLAAVIRRIYTGESVTALFD